MNKKALIVGLVLIIVIGASMAYALLRKDNTAYVDEGAPSGKESKPADEKGEVSARANGVYVDYSEDVLASTKGTKLLFFHAPWCPQCRALDESIRSSALPDDVTIFKVDYDSNQALRAKYGVTIQTTMVKVDDKGNKLASYVAYDEPTFQSVKQALLP
jgi:thiol-disulfide isomerase/thioredoxin